MRKFLLIIALMTWVVPAWAGGTGIDFTGNTPGGQGILAFKPGVGHDLIITGALISNILNSFGVCGGNCTVVGGTMSVITAGETGVTGAYTYSFGAGGTIDIFGKIPSLGINTTTLLFSATFLNGTFTVAGTLGVFAANINLASVVLDSKLGTYTFGSGGSETLSLDLKALCSTGGACLGSITQASANLGVISEPSTLILLGSGLAAFAGVIRRRKWLART
jgi:hypothetical protein